MAGKKKEVEEKVKEYDPTVPYVEENEGLDCDTTGAHKFNTKGKLYKISDQELKKICYKFNTLKVLPNIHKIGNEYGETTITYSLSNNEKPKGYIYEIIKCEGLSGLETKLKKNGITEYDYIHDINISYDDHFLIGYIPKEV